MAVRDRTATPENRTQRAAVAAGAPEPAAAPAPTRWWRGWFTTICAVIGLAAGALGLFWDLLPQYRPDPLDTVGAEVGVAAIEPRVTIAEFLRRTRGDDFSRAARDIFGRPPSRSELRQPGELLYVRTQVDGHKHKDIALTYTLFDGVTHKPVLVPLPPALERGPLQRARLSAPSQRSIQLLWLPDLSSEPDVFVRVHLTSDRGLLAIADSGHVKHGILQD